MAKYQYFIASRWRNREVVELFIDSLRQKGKSVYSFFEGDGSDYALKTAETNLSPEVHMHLFENIPDWQNNQIVREVFDMDMEALTNSEALILLLPAGISAHIEAGVAFGMGKKCILIGEPKEAESLYYIFTETYRTTEDFLQR